MKKIKLNGVTMTEAEARSVIIDLERQLDAPDVPEFWEGQLVQRGDSRGVYVYEKQGELSDNNSKLICSDGRYVTWVTETIRPLQDQLILQFKPHKPGDPMPCGKNELVLVKTVDGRVVRVLAKNVLWVNGGYDQAIGWMPADGWGGGE